MKYRLVWILVLVLTCGGVLSAAPARAVITVGVSPSIVELSGKPGGTGTVDLNVFNQGDEAFDVEIVPETYDRATDRSRPEWLTPSVGTAHLDVGGQSVVTISITIPDDTDPGGYYAIVAIRTVAGDGGENATGISGQLSVPFLITVEGKYKRKAEITQFAGFLELDGRLGFRAVANNDGEIHWKPASTLTVKKGDGSDYGTLEVDNSAVFPQTSSTLSTTSTLPVTSGESFQAEIAIDYGAKKPVKAETEFTFTPEFTVTGSVCENLDKGPTITALYDNTGDLGVITNLVMAVASADGQAIGQTGMVGPNLIWPASSVPVATDLQDRLPTGDYLLTIQYLTGASADPVSLEVPFSIGGTGPNVAPICPQLTETPAA